MDVAVIGLGLIGGSLVRALAAAGHRVRGYDTDPGTRALARTAAARQPAAHRWEVASSVRDAASGVELVVPAVPLPALRVVLDGLAGYDGLISDVTSVKAPVARLLAGRRRYVGGHPMAGRERVGFANADERLFQGAPWVLALDPGTPLADWLSMAELVTALGAHVVPVTSMDHDAAVARVSHVPHLVAAAVAASAADPLVAGLGAGSFRDGTRVAASPPSLVAAMCGGNAGPVRAALDELIEALRAARRALDAPEPIGALADWLAPGHEIRSAWPPRPGMTADVPADRDILLRLGRAGGWVTGVNRAHGTVDAVLPAD